MEFPQHPTMKLFHKYACAHDTLVTQYHYDKTIQESAFIEQLFSMPGSKLLLTCLTQQIVVVYTYFFIFADFIRSIH